MRKVSIALMLLAVAGCTSTGQLTPQAAQTVSVVCADDVVAYTAGQTAGVVVPVPAVQTGLAVDALLVHPAVVAACSALGKVPVAAAPAPTPAPVAVTPAPTA